MKIIAFPRGMRCGRGFRGHAYLIATAVFFSLAALAPAQYRIFSWESFESGQVPPTLQFLHDAAPPLVTLFDYTQPGVPPVFSEEKTLRECGRFGLKVSTTALADRDCVVSLLSHLQMERGLLGASGRALYQADFYLPAESEGYFPNAAILAYSNSEPQQKWFEMYRFGIRLNKFLYFSFSDRKQGGKIIKQDSIESFHLRRPGWSRLQIIFEGQNRILCAVNGIPTSFSPIEEPSLTLLQPGIMIASAKEKSGYCIIDNLSIQWTPEDVPIPDSPWLETAAPAPSSASAFSQPPPPAAAGRIDAESGQAEPAWFTSPEEAWKASQEQNRPVLAVFYAPRAKHWRAFESLLQSQPAIRQTLSRFVPLKVDMNTLQGGAIAGKFQVFRVPCFLVLGPDGRSRLQMVMNDDTPWEAIAAELRKIAPQP